MTTALSYEAYLEREREMSEVPFGGYGNATAQAHAEWHCETGQKYGCPWDCCQPPEPEPTDLDELDATAWPSFRGTDRAYAGVLLFSPNYCDGGYRCSCSQHTMPETESPF